MAGYNQTVPEQFADDGTTLLFDKSQQETCHNTMAMWNEIEESLKDKVDDEIRNLRHRIHHLLDERKAHCEFVLGLNNCMMEEGYNDVTNCQQIQQLNAEQQQQQQQFEYTCEQQEDQQNILAHEHFQKNGLQDTPIYSRYDNESTGSGFSSQFSSTQPFQPYNSDINDHASDSNDAYVMCILAAAVKVYQNLKPTEAENDDE